MLLQTELFLIVRFLPSIQGQLSFHLGPPQCSNWALYKNWEVTMMVTTGPTPKKTFIAWESGRESPQHSIPPWYWYGTLVYHPTLSTAFLPNSNEYQIAIQIKHAVTFTTTKPGSHHCIHQPSTGWERTSFIIFKKRTSIPDKKGAVYASWLWDTFPSWNTAPSSKQGLKS